MNAHLFIVLLGVSLLFSACSGSDTDSESISENTSDDETTDDDTVTDPETEGNYISALFHTSAIAEEIVSCTLENGSTTTCYQLTYQSNNVGDTEGNGTVGPYCPPSINTIRSEAGVGIYDGDTNPGFQSLVDAAISMDEDGYDIIDEDGNIRFSDLSQSSEIEGFSYCLSAPFDSTLEVSILIPVVPELRDEAYNVGTVENLGISINGIPITGNPPSVTVMEDGVGGTGSGNIPSIDLCGGHADPSGYYHWHFIPQSINTLYNSDNFNFTELYGLTCSNSNIEFDNPSAFAGLAKDGYPIYAAFDLENGENVLPSEIADLDECNGHMHSNNDYPDGVYHYHAFVDEAPNLPPCLKGSFVNRSLSIQ